MQQHYLKYFDWIYAFKFISCVIARSPIYWKVMLYVEHMFAIVLKEDFYPLIWN